MSSGIRAKRSGRRHVRLGRQRVRTILRQLRRSRRQWRGATIGEQFAQVIAARLARAVRRIAPVQSVLQRERVPWSPVILQQRWLWASHFSISLRGPQSTAEGRVHAAAGPAPTLVRTRGAERHLSLTQIRSQRVVLRDIRHERVTEIAKSAFAVSAAAAAVPRTPLATWSRRSGALPAAPQVLVQSSAATVPTVTPTPLMSMPASADERVKANVGRPDVSPPLPLKPHEVNRLADQVMHLLDRRIVAQRERRGRS